MRRNNKKGFTLIELIAVLVIMAIIALIVTPLVMNIIRKARISADKRSIDAYGRSIEIASMNYMLENGDFPTDIGDMTIEYAGPEVVCTTTQLNSDYSVYLTGCTVAGRSVDYKYGKDKESYDVYSVGDQVSYNGVTYFVIEDSGRSNEKVKLLKETPLLKTEIDALNISGLNIVDINSYGAVYYGSDNGYNTSKVKEIVDAWKATAVASGDTAKARLITYDELTDNLGYEKKADENILPSSAGTTPTWVYSNRFRYWTMTQYKTTSNVWGVDNDGHMNSFNYQNGNTVRPVLELSKSANISIVN